VRDSWLTVIDAVLRPARPRLERCLGERERHVVARRPVVIEHARALADCQARIESVRAAVFAAQDGRVTAEMTELEREWRTLSRRDTDGGLMDLWASVVPPSWVDRKRWRDSEPAERLDAAIALASDVDGVEAAESAVDALRIALAGFGIVIGPRLRWRGFDSDVDGTTALLVTPLRAARDALAVRGAEAVVFERAQRVEKDVLDAANVRFPERPLLAQSLARAALVDCAWTAAPLGVRPNPVTALRALWATGYVLTAADATGATLELPPLAARP
jgi:hypothetical protein